MNKKTIFLLIYIVFVLCSNAFARPVGHDNRNPLLDSMANSHYNSTAIISFDRNSSLVDDSVLLSEDSLSWDSLSDYPYVLMSYFSEMYKLNSSDEGKRDAIFKRLNILNPMCEFSG